MAQDKERMPRAAMCAPSLSFSVPHRESVGHLSNALTSTSDGVYSIERSDPVRRDRSVSRVLRGAAWACLRLHPFPSAPDLRSTSGSTGVSIMLVYLPGPVAAQAL